MQQLILRPATVRITTNSLLTIISMFTAFSKEYVSFSQNANVSNIKEVKIDFSDATALT